MRKEYFECKCVSEEHLLRFSLDEENNELYSEVHLRQWRSWYKRTWVGIKYIFGYTCKYGHWDCNLFKDEDISRLLALCNEALDNSKPPKVPPARKLTDKLWG